ncbi:hypothetical protein D3C87_1324240 [compost metagenome]
MKRSSILSIFLVLSTGTTAWSQPQELNFIDQGIYEETLESCSQFKFMGDHLKSFLISAGQGFTLIKESIAPSDELQREVEQLIRHKGISPYLYERLNSEGFMQALRECFPNSEAKRNFYVGSMMFSDSAGRLPAAVVLYITSKISAKGVGAIFAYSKTAGVVTVGTVTLASSVSVYKEVKKRYSVISEKVEADLAILGEMSSAPVELQLEQADIILRETIIALEARLQTEANANTREQIQIDIQTLKSSLSKKG